MVKEMKRKLFFFCFLCIFVWTLAAGLVGCAGDKGSFHIWGEADNSRIRIVCTTFPQYDWVRNMIKDNEEQFSLILLMENGGDLHSFQPSALDIARISSCDLFIYVGGESDGWVADALKEAVNTDMRVINMMEVVEANLIEEEHIEGMKAHHHAHGHNGYEEMEEEHAYDEHVWLSLRNAALLAERIADVLVELDSTEAHLYRKNCEDYVKRLQALDAAFVQAVESGSADTLLFADRFPFLYFVEDYGLNYYAAFDGCSAETEASFETVAFLAGKLDELGLDTVLVLDGSDDRLAQVIIENTHTMQQQILILHSLQSVSKKDIQNGMDYLSVMEENLHVLERALHTVP